MNFSELMPGIPVRIALDHPNGYGGRIGKVIAVGTFEGGPKRIGALVDIHEPCLLVVEPEDLEQVDPDPPSPGWEEFDV